MKKKMLALFMGGLLLAGGAVTGASAAYQSYTGYMLYSNYQNNYTSYHSKTTSNQYMLNKMTALSGTSSATFWACDNQSSSDYDTHRAISTPYTTSTVNGSATTMNFKSKYNKKSGDKVALGMEDGVYHSSSVGKVSGQVDFR